MARKNNNALFFTCSLIEYIGRTQKQRRWKVTDYLGMENIKRIYNYADVFHCEPIEKVAAEFTEQCDIGQKNTCLQGAELLKELETRSQGRIIIQAGSGVGAEVIRQLYPLTGIKAYHMSGKVVTDSAMQFRKEGVNMGLPTFSEYEIWRTDIENVRAAKKVLEEL